MHVWVAGHGVLLMTGTGMHPGLSSADHVYAVAGPGRVRTIALTATMLVCGATASAATSLGTGGTGLVGIVPLVALLAALAGIAALWSP